MTRIGDLTWPVVRDCAAAGAVLAVPLGSTEQHGPHLPLSTDADVAETLCTGLAEARGSVVVAPTIAYGASGEHAGFAGTLSIGTDALATMLVELGRSACETFSRVLLVSAHGGNHVAVTRAVATLRAESRDVSSWMPSWDGDAHAGFVETSMQLTIDGSRVRTESAVPGVTSPIDELMPALRAGGVRAVSANGVLGDPVGADAEHGRTIIDGLLSDLVAVVDGWTGARG